MLQHHLESIKKLKDHFADHNEVVAIILDGSIVKGTARPNSDIDAILIVEKEFYDTCAKQNRLGEVIYGYCTYPEGYFDIKYKTKEFLQQAAQYASEPTRNAYLQAEVLYTKDPEIQSLVRAIATYPEHDRPEKIRCFNANLQLNRGYFLHCVPETNIYMRTHLATEIVYSVYRLILAENRKLFPCNRRLEEAVFECTNRPPDILSLGQTFLKDISVENCERFVQAFWKQSELPLTDEININCSNYIRFYEDWWQNVRPPFPNEW